jgi:hypothetical protein
MIVAIAPFLHIHVWEIVVHCDTKSIIIVIHAVMRLISYIMGFLGRNYAPIVLWENWRLWNEKY